MNLKVVGILIVGAVLIGPYSTSTSAHHSVLHYDGKKEVTISGECLRDSLKQPH